jgi:hypothetical protein
MTLHAPRKCYYCVTGVFRAGYPEPKLKYFVRFCYRPWSGLTFFPTIQELRSVSQKF